MAIQRSSSWSGFLALMLLLGLLFIAIHYARVLHEAYVDSGEWQAVDALIDASAVVPASCGKGGDKYRVKLQYRYAVLGRQHLGSRIAFGDVYCGPWRGARDIALQYPAGLHLTAYVDPAHADRAVLERGRVSAQTWTSVLPILLAAGAFLALGLWGWLRKAPPRAPPGPRPGGGF